MNYWHLHGHFSVFSPCFLRLFSGYIFMRKRCIIFPALRRYSILCLHYKYRQVHDSIHSAMPQNDRCACRVRVGASVHRANFSDVQFWSATGSQNLRHARYSAIWLATSAAVETSPRRHPNTSRILIGVLDREERSHSVRQFLDYLVYNGTGANIYRRRMNDELIVEAVLSH